MGIGFDAHRLVAGRALILGGVNIPYHLGLLGHSDADVLVHAIGDAVLGALALGDLGTHFPDTDPAYKDVSSLRLLEQITRMAQEAGYRLGNMDATIIAQQPRLAPHIPQMRQNLARILAADPAQISIKATTTEGLGWTGRGEGIAALAVVCLVKSEMREVESEK